VTYNQVHVQSYQINLLKQIFKAIVIAHMHIKYMKQYIYMHKMYGYTNIVQTKAIVKLQINLTLVGYLLYLGIENVE